MKKTCILRSLLGVAIAITISLTFSMMISLNIHDGNFYFTSPAMIKDFGTPLNAAFIQYMLTVIYGAVLGAMSMVWQKENWSLLKQTIVHMVVCTTTTFPVAYICYWMDHSIFSILMYFVIFISIYSGIWMFTYQKYKYNIAAFNQKINDMNK